MGVCCIIRNEAPVESICRTLLYRSDKGSGDSSMLIKAALSRTEIVEESGNSAFFPLLFATPDSSTISVRDKTAFMSTITTVFIGSTQQSSAYELYQSFIVDNGADIHLRQ
jgi:hypothetical protein